MHWRQVASLIDEQALCQLARNSSSTWQDALSPNFLLGDCLLQAGRAATMPVALTRTAAAACPPHRMRWQQLPRPRRLLPLGHLPLPLIHRPASPPVSWAALAAGASPGGLARGLAAGVPYRCTDRYRVAGRPSGEGFAVCQHGQLAVRAHVNPHVPQWLWAGAIGCAVCGSSEQTCSSPWHRPILHEVYQPCCREAVRQQALR